MAVNVRFAVVCFGVVAVALLLLPTATNATTTTTATTLLLWRAPALGLLLYSLLRFCRDTYGTETFRRDAVFAAAALAPVCVSLPSLPPQLALGFLAFAAALLAEGRPLAASLCAALLCAVDARCAFAAAPPLLLFVLRTFCLAPRARPSVFTRRERMLSVWPTRFLAVIAFSAPVLALAYGPFVPSAQTLRRQTNPFDSSSGGFSADDEPNFWTLYALLDRLLRIGLRSSVLPRPHAFASAALAAGSMLPALFKLWRGPQSVLRLVLCVVQCSLCLFFFGWSVHRQFLAVPMLSLAMLAGKSKPVGRMSLLLMSLGHFALMPLAMAPMEIPVFRTLVAAHTLLQSLLLLVIHPDPPIFLFGNRVRVAKTWRGLGVAASGPETLFVFGLVPLEMICTVLTISDVSAAWATILCTFRTVYHALGLLYLLLRLSGSSISDSLQTTTTN